MIKKSTHIFTMCWLIIQSVMAQDSIILLMNKERFTVGENISLIFSNPSNEVYHLYCSNSFGTTILSGKLSKNKLEFEIPSFMSNKTGVIAWKLIHSSSKLTGKLFIQPSEKSTSLETYIGPPTIEAGGKDFAMAVIIPTDSLDNPVKKNTGIVIKNHFYQTPKSQQIFTKNLIGYQNIFSPLKTGRMTVSSESFGLNSKEYDVDILPAIGTNFNIVAKRNHEYADGNQITKFSTSIIKDKNNNIVSDGTFVEFYIRNKESNILKTSGTTINGIAEAFIVHPDCEENWTVKAFINGIANSNTIKISYKKVIDTIPVSFSKDNRTVKVAPLQSFMKQMIPDGLQVRLSIYKDNKLENHLIEQSKDGFAIFNLDPNIYKAGNYTIEISAACNTITHKSIKLW
ncbi:hypothetical protein ACOSP6_08135 [Tenacibaculum sp. MEBiC06402]|uniref:hypothetical protein n=1 Tax=unclassified Tenacibaculum TaxID=2635139 RepID=UPI003B9BC235